LFFRVSAWLYLFACIKCLFGSDTHPASDEQIAGIVSGTADNKRCPGFG